MNTKFLKSRPFLSVVLILALFGSVSVLPVSGASQDLGKDDSTIEDQNSYIFTAHTPSLEDVEYIPTVAMLQDSFLVAFNDNSDSNGVVTRTSTGTRVVAATGYSSTVDQTDSTPFITANGKRVYDGLIAANFLKFGTKVKIPEIFGEKIFTVDDRMNARYADRIDVWFPDRQSAIEFGLRTVRIEII